MKFWLNLILVIASASLMAQDSTAHRSRWSVGLNVAPAYTYRNLKVLESNSATSAIVGLRNEHEIPLYTVQAMAMAAYSLSNTFAIEAGIGYSRYGWDWPLKDLSFGDQIDPRRGFIYTTGDVAIPRTFRQVFDHLDLPVRGVVTIGNGNWRWIGSLGVSASIMVRASHISIYDNDRSSYDQDNFERFNLFPMIGTGVSYHRNDRHEFRLEPIFRYGVLKIIDAPITGYLWSAGVNVGYFRTF